MYETWVPAGLTFNVSLPLVLLAAILALPLRDATDPERFDWIEGEALVDSDPGGHLAEHELDVRRWLASAPLGSRERGGD